MDGLRKSLVQDKMEFTDPSGDFEADERRGKIRSQVVFFLCLAGTIGRFSDAADLPCQNCPLRHSCRDFDSDSVLNTIPGAWRRLSVELWASIRSESCWVSVTNNLLLPACDF